MKQINSNAFCVFGGELYVTGEGFRRIFVAANEDISLIESAMFADMILGHFQDEHDDEIMTIDETDYVSVYTIMNHVDAELNKQSLMFARMYEKLFDVVGDELLPHDLENPEDWPYLSPWVAQAYLEVLRIVGKYLQVVETAEHMRRALLVEYLGEAWKKKIAKMSDAQVQAIYSQLTLED